MNLSHLGCVVALSTALGAAIAPGEEPTDEAVITVNARRSPGPINPLVFGNNLEAANPQFIFGPHSNPVQGRTGDGVWNPDTGAPVPEGLRAARRIGIRMMRYPGGCLVHNFDWRKAVGPRESRPDYLFGIDEFVAWCRQAGAEPLMTTSAYVGGPDDMAGLVEYCNAPATEAHPMAMLRARGGNTEPFGIVYFEMGNESDHGNHEVEPRRKHTPESYAEWFRESARRMRAVDPAIRIGGLTGTGTGPGDPWNRTVLTAAGKEMDFVVVHTYAVGLWQREPEDPDRYLRAALAAGDQFGRQLDEYNALIRECTGKAIPLAITEYNAAYVQEKPKPYRFSAAAALFAADFVRVLLEPERNVCMANYWHFMNGYWGMIQGPRVPADAATQWRTMPAGTLFGIWADYTGTEWLAADTRSPVREFEGAGNVTPARLPRAEGPLSPALRPGQYPGLSWSVEADGALNLKIAGAEGEHYPPFGRVDIPRGTPLRLSFDYEVIEGTLPEGATLGIGLIDARGWNATRSGAAVDRMRPGGKGESLATEMNPLPDCTALDLTWRLIGARTPTNITLRVLNLTVTALPEAPPFPVVTACASTDGERGELTLVVFNKDHEKTIPTTIRFDGATVGAGTFRQVAAPAPDVMDLSGCVSEGETPPPGADRSIRIALPPLSMTGFRFPVR